MKSFAIASTVLVLAFAAMLGSTARATVPPTVLWQDNFAGQTQGTSISTLGWSAIPGFNTLTSYTIETALEPPRSVRTYGMGVNAVYTLYQPVTGMDAKTSQWLHFLAHQANGNGTSLLDAVRVSTSGSCVFYFLIAERQTMAVTESPGGVYDSGNLGDKLSDGAWHDFDIKFDNAAGNQTVSFYINNAPTPVWSRVVANPGYITSVQFVQQGGAKPTTGENHLIGEMRIGSADCAHPAAPTGIAASPATICSGVSSTLSVNDPGAGLTTDWFTASCGGTPVAGGTGANSVIVSPTATTTYYARTRNTADGCASLTCQSVTVTIPNCDDSNACTTDTCSNGACSHTNVANGTACEDGNPCTQGDTCQNGTCASGTPVDPCDTSNDFDANWTLALRGGDYESQIRVLDKACTSGADPSHCDLGRFGGQAKSVVTYHKSYEPDGWQDSSSIKSFCFSNSPVAGAHSPAGARLFGVYEVRNLETDYDNNGNMVTQEGQQETYSSAGFQIVELNAAGQRIRVMEVGLAASLYDGVHRGINDPNGPNTDRNILTDPHWGPYEEGWVWTRNNIGGVRIGNIRYNKAKDTLCVAAIVREHGNDDANLPPVGRVYEFALPDYEPQVYTGGPYVGEPIPESDPSKIKLVQIYDMPCSCLVDGVYHDGVTPGECRALGGTWEGHSVQKDNGGVNEGEHQRPAITFDDDGNMYFTSLFCAATGIEWAGSYWTGANAYHGDVIKCSTIGRWGGKNVYTVPIHGADACNVVISAYTEDPLLASEYPQLPPSLYASGPGLAVRGSLMNQLLQMPEVTCNDTNNLPWFSYINIFDLTATRTDHPCELERIKSVHRSIPVSGLNWTDSTRTLYCDPGVGAFAGYTWDVNWNVVVFSAGTGVMGINATAYVVAAKLSNDAIQLRSDMDINGAGGNITNDSIAGEINLSRADLPRSPLWAQYDELGERTYLGGRGACDCRQNFMYITNDDTVVYDVGYHLNSDGVLDRVWDGAAPPPIPPDNQIGACCNEAAGTCTDDVNQTACAAAGGLWLGKGSICGQHPCPGQGACCTRCGRGCRTVYETQCAGANDVWHGAGTICGQVVCELCSVQPMDTDCDNDVDQLDFAAFQACFALAATPPSVCACFDRGLDAPAGDGDIDSHDLTVFELCASGPGVPGSAACVPTSP